MCFTHWTTITHKNNVRSRFENLKKFYENSIEILTPNATKYGEVTDAHVLVYINFYRNRYAYNLAYFRSMCKSQLIECPIVEKNYYTINVDLFISRRDIIGETSDTVNH